VRGRDGRPEAIVIDQAPPELGRAVTDRDELAEALGLEPSGRALADDVPARVVSTGAAHLLVPVRDRTGRPSRIRVQVSGEHVRIEGAGVVVAEGTLTV
jgi:predicted PhzF superfamily epimerase YddE/YHI9